MLPVTSMDESKGNISKIKIKKLCICILNFQYAFVPNFKIDVYTIVAYYYFINFVINYVMNN